MAKRPKLLKNTWAMSGESISTPTLGKISFPFAQQRQEWTALHMKTYNILSARRNCWVGSSQPERCPHNHVWDSWLWWHHPAWQAPNTLSMQRSMISDNSNGTVATCKGQRSCSVLMEQTTSCNYVGYLQNSLHKSE